MRETSVEKSLRDFRFSEETSFQWDSLDKELKRVQDLLRQTSTVNKGDEDRRQAILLIITKILAAHARRVEDSEVSRLSSRALEKDINKLGAALLKQAKKSEPAKDGWTRRSFVRMLGFLAADAALGGSIIKLVTPQQTKTVEKRLKPGYYFQLVAETTIAEAKKEAEALEREYGPLGPLEVVFLPRTASPYKVFVRQRFETFDGLMNIAQLTSAAYPKLVFGLVRITEDGERRWLKSFLQQTEQELSSIRQEFSETSLAGFTPAQRRYYPLIESACRRYPITTRPPSYVDPLLVLAMMKVESDYKPDARSGVGAKGLLQLMPKMWQHFHAESTLYHATGAKAHHCDPFDPGQNIDAAVHMISYLSQHYPMSTPHREALIILAYHAGETNVNRGRIGRRTRAYRQHVLAEKERLRKQT